MAKLENGLILPSIGYGTWLIPQEEASEKTKDAISLGYRLIDTAEAYENEAGVGQGIRECGLQRDQIILTTKLRAEAKDYETAKADIEASLKALDVGYIDLMLIHSPEPWAYFRSGEHWFDGNLKAWKALEDAYKEGKIKAIGVSNFEIPDLENLIRRAEIPPMVNQILAHVGAMPRDVIDYCQKRSIVLEAYSPMGHGEILSDPRLVSVSERIGVGIPQICLRYLQQKGLIPLPKASSVTHMKANLALDFTLSDEDIRSLDAIEGVDYKDSSFWPVFSKKKD